MMGSMTWTTLDIALVQEPAGLDPEANRARLDALTPTGVDLVVFPEVFARDFGRPGTSLGEYAEDLDGPFGAEVDRVARDRGTTVVAGMLERAEADQPATPYNTLIVRGAATGSYRKIHLYDSFGYRESDVLAAGPLTPTVVEVAGARIGLMTCYDLRFPELARALVDAGAEILVVPAAWVAGERKVDHWRTLVRARAIENTVFVAACFFVLASARLALRNCWSCSSKSFGSGARRSSVLPEVGWVKIRCSACSITRFGGCARRGSGFQP